MLSREIYESSASKVKMCSLGSKLNLAVINFLYKDGDFNTPQIIPNFPRPSFFEDYLPLFVTLNKARISSGNQKAKGRGCQQKQGFDPGKQKSKV